MAMEQLSIGFNVSQFIGHPFSIGPAALKNVAFKYSLIGLFTQATADL
jgi:hypothetical protein